MPKISALPPMVTAADDDEQPIVDKSVVTTKKWTLSLLKTYLQSLTAWITGGMIGSGTITHTNIGFPGVIDSGFDGNNTSGNTTTTYMDVCSVTITPKSTSSKIILMGELATYCDNTASGRSGKFRLLCNGAVIGTDPIDAAIGAIDGTTNVNARTPFTYAHSPASVAAQTYKVQIAANGAYLFYKNNSNRFSSMLALELKQ